ncbi:MAG: glycosyltransferase family 39 protein [Candidatus Levybacteria bacterium]|nr:glycosyltransferase family 39 protein [Candidatus Levybacteria bacterium]
MNIFIVLITILFMSFVGYVVIRLFTLLPKKMVLFTIGCSYGLGAGLISLQLYLYSRFNISWSKESLIFPWIILIVLFLFKNMKKMSFKFLRTKKTEPIHIVFIIMILITVSYVFFEVLLRPVTVWDGWAIWLLRAKLFFIDGKINSLALNYVKSDYPLIISLLNTFIYLILGKVDDSAVLLTSFAFYIFLAIGLFSVLKNKFSLTYALLFTFLLMTIQTFVRQGGRLEAGQADLPLGYYIFISTIFLIEYLKNSSAKFLLSLNIFLGITILVKPEGLFTAVAISVIAIFNIHMKKIYHQLKFFIIWIIFFLDWEIYKKFNNLKYTYISAHPLEMTWGKTLNAIWGTLKELVNIKSWNLLWVSYFASLLMKVPRNETSKILNIIILSQLGAYIFMYIFTARNTPESSIERLLVHIAPLGVYSIAISMRQLLKNFQNISH